MVKPSTLSLFEREMHDQVAARATRCRGRTPRRTAAGPGGRRVTSRAWSTWPAATAWRRREGERRRPAARGATAAGGARRLTLGQDRRA